MNRKADIFSGWGTLLRYLLETTCHSAPKYNWKLRILAIHGAKATNNQTLWHVLFDYFTTRPSFKNMYDTFEQMARDAKNV